MNNLFPLKFIHSLSDKEEQLMLVKSKGLKVNRELNRTLLNSFIGHEKGILSKMTDPKYSHSPNPYLKTNEKSRWDFFTIKLDKKTVDKIIKKTGHGKHQNIILDNCTVIDHSGDALSHFGFSDFEQGLKLKDLVNRWNEHLSDGNNSTGWVEDLTDEISRAITNKPPKPSWKPLKSVSLTPKSFFYPIVNRIRRFESSGDMEIDIYMIKIQEAKAG